jgi:hypothetical protein
MNLLLGLSKSIQSKNNHFNGTHSKCQKSPPHTVMIREGTNLRHLKPIRRFFPRRPLIHDSAPPPFATLPSLTETPLGRRILYATTLVPERARNLDPGPVFALPSARTMRLFVLGIWLRGTR